MRILYLAATFVLFALFVGCAAAKYSTNQKRVVVEQPDYCISNNISPLKFLKALTFNPSKHVFLKESHRAWVKPKDVNDLLLLIDSPEFCSPVVMTDSSSLPPTPSTIGREAQFILLAFKEGAYPPALSSDTVCLDKGALIEWFIANGFRVQKKAD